MPLVMDPAGQEIRALQRATEWERKRVIEIGCGDGRLTLRLAAFAPKHIEALDPDAKRIRMARRNLPARYNRRVAYHMGHAGRLRYASDLFDIAIFAWAL